MTVCIAAICENGTIFGASDRMLTAGDTEFEPSLEEKKSKPTKIFALTRSIFALTAGDSALQSEIVQDLVRVIGERVKAEPNNWWKVKDVAEFYVHYYDEAKKKRIQTQILAPFGLNHESFLEKQSGLAPGFVDKITKEMINFYIDPVTTIITGVDEEGSHIFSIDNNLINCMDAIGFAAIGSGARHAQSQFMLAGHSRQSSLEETLVLTYTAKKRSEIAPGVGEGTDMIMIGPGLGHSDVVRYDAVKKLDHLYNQIKKEENTTLKKAVKKTEQYVKKLRKKSQPQKQEQVAPKEIPDGTPPANGREVPVDPKKS